MDYELNKRASIFSSYVCAELKGTIVSRGYSQGEVADGIKRQKANISRWLNGKPVIPMDVAHEICEFIGADLQEIVSRAERRLIDEYGEWPQPAVDVSSLSPDERIAITMRKMEMGGMGLAAHHDENKEKEMEGGDDW